MNKQVVIIAGSEYGEIKAYYEIVNNKLHLKHYKGDTGLAGNHIALEFDGVNLEDVPELRRKLLDENVHGAERCGCHLCNLGLYIIGLDQHL